MANSTRLSKMPRRTCSSRGDNVSERAISAHACSLNIVELGACRRERASLRLFARLFTTPSSLSHGKAAVHPIRFWRHSPRIGLESKPFGNGRACRARRRICSGAITENLTIRHLWPIWQPLSSLHRSWLTVEGRPIINLSLAINYAPAGCPLPSGQVAGGDRALRTGAADRTRLCRGANRARPTASSPVSRVGRERGVPREHRTNSPWEFKPQRSRIAAFGSESPRPIFELTVGRPVGVIPSREARIVTKRSAAQ